MLRLRGFITSQAEKNRIIEARASSGSATTENGNGQTDYVYNYPLYLQVSGSDHLISIKHTVLKQLCLVE